MGQHPTDPGVMMVSETERSGGGHRTEQDAASTEDVRHAETRTTPSFAYRVVIGSLIALFILGAALVVVGALRGLL